MAAYGAYTGKGKGGGGGGGGGGGASGPSAASNTLTGGPTTATAAAYGSGLDSSAWNVNFSGTQTSANGLPSTGGIPAVALYAIGGLIAWKILKKSA